MSTIGKRIAEARAAAKLSQAKLASMIGVDTRTVSYWENNHQKPDRHLAAVAKALDVSTDWLLGQTSNTKARVHEGGFITAVSPMKEPAKPAENYKSIKIKDANFIAVPGMNVLKVLAKAAADKNIAFAEAIETALADKRFNPKDHYGLVVHGRSMYPTIAEGDRVIVRAVRFDLLEFDPERGPSDASMWKKLHESVVVAQVNDGDALIKRLFVYDQPKGKGGFMIMLQSDNRSVAPIPVWRDTKLEIVGVVQEILRDPRNYE